MTKINQIYKKLIGCFDNRPTIKKGGKNYFVVSLIDQQKAADPEVLRQAVNALSDIVNWNSSTPINKIVAKETKSGFIAVCLALQRNLPFSLAKSNPVHLPGEIVVEKTKDSRKENRFLYFNGLEKRDRVLILDDIINSGETMVAIIKAMREAGIEVKEAVALAERIDGKGVSYIKAKTGVRVKTIIRLDIAGEKSKVVGTIFDKQK